MDSPLADNPFAPNNETVADATATKPIVIELRQMDKSDNGNFRPEASLKLTPALRTSGLLLSIPGEDLKNFLFLLSFVTPNGDCVPAVSQLAEAMHVSPLKVQARMRRLTNFIWNGEPLVLFLKRESSIDAFAPNPRLLVYEQVAQSVSEAAGPRYRVAGRDAIIAHSRAHYARPRAEVESAMALQNGWPLPEATAPEPAVREKESQPAVPAPTPSITELTPVQGETLPNQSAEQARVWRRLWNLGLNREQIDALLARYDLVRIERQVQWLPYRKVRNRAGFLIAAIEDDYEAPLTLRKQIGTSDDLEATASDSPDTQRGDPSRAAPGEVSAASVSPTAHS